MPKQRAPQTQDSKELALITARILDQKKGADIVILDVSGPLVIADYFVIATASNPRHAQALGRELESTMKKAGLPRRNVAGMEGESRWVLLDFDDVVVHIFLPESRTFYALETLWADLPELPFEPDDPPGPGHNQGNDDGREPSAMEIRPGKRGPDSTTPT